MAIVRRSAVVGRASVPTIPQQPVSGAPLGIPPQPAPVAAGAEAAAAGNGKASPLIIAVSFGLVVIGGVVAFCIWRWGSNPTALRPGGQTSAFGLLIIFAAAVERLLEPFTQWMPGTKQRARLEQVTAAMVNGHPMASLADVANAKAAVDRAVKNKSVLTWGLATGLATVVSSAGGFYLLRSLGVDGSTSPILPWADALLTGLIVGSGTKPMHDWLARLQGTKDAATGGNG
jgi:hypothetical protein